MVANFFTAVIALPLLKKTWWYLYVRISFSLSVKKTEMIECCWAGANEPLHAYVIHAYYVLGDINILLFHSDICITILTMGYSGSRVSQWRSKWEEATYLWLQHRHHYSAASIIFFYFRKYWRKWLCQEEVIVTLSVLPCFPSIYAP